MQGTIDNRQHYNDTSNKATAKPTHRLHRLQKSFRLRSTHMAAENITNILQNKHANAIVPDGNNENMENKDTN